MSILSNFFCYTVPSCSEIAVLQKVWITQSRRERRIFSSANPAALREINFHFIQALWLTRLRVVLVSSGHSLVLSRGCVRLFWVLVIETQRRQSAEKWKRCSQQLTWSVHTILQVLHWRLFNSCWSHVARARSRSNETFTSRATHVIRIAVIHTITSFTSD